MHTDSMTTASTMIMTELDPEDVSSVALLLVAGVPGVCGAGVAAFAGIGMRVPATVSSVFGGFLAVPVPVPVPGSGVVLVVVSHTHPFTAPLQVPVRCSPRRGHCMLSHV